jgi:hypothetical protein
MKVKKEKRVTLKPDHGSKDWKKRKDAFDVAHPDTRLSAPRSIKELKAEEDLTWEFKPKTGLERIDKPRSWKELVKFMTKEKLKTYHSDFIGMDLEVKVRHLGPTLGTKCCTIVDIKFEGLLKVVAKDSSYQSVNANTPIEGRWELGQCEEEQADFESKPACETVKFVLDGYSVSMKGDYENKDADKEWSGELILSGKFELWVNQYKSGEWSGKKPSTTTQIRRNGAMPEGHKISKTK